jgi:hypothetical protein
MSTTRHLVLDLALFVNGNPDRIGATVYPSDVPGSKSFQATSETANVVNETANAVGEKPCPACAGKHRAHTCAKGKAEAKKQPEPAKAEKPANAGKDMKESVDTDKSANAEDEGPAMQPERRLWPFRA